MPTLPPEDQEGTAPLAPQDSALPAEPSVPPTTEPTPGPLPVEEPAADWWVQDATPPGAPPTAPATTAPPSVAVQPPTGTQPPASTAVTDFTQLPESEQQAILKQWGEDPDTRARRVAADEVDRRAEAMVKRFEALLDERMPNVAQVAVRNRESINYMLDASFAQMQRAQPDLYAEFAPEIAQARRTLTELPNAQQIINEKTGAWDTLLLGLRESGLKTNPNTALARLVKAYRGVKPTAPATATPPPGPPPPRLSGSDVSGGDGNRETTSRQAASLGARALKHLEDKLNA